MPLYCLSDECSGSHIDEALMHGPEVLKYEAVVLKFHLSSVHHHNSVIPKTILTPQFGSIPRKVHGVPVLALSAQANRKIFGQSTRSLASVLKATSLEGQIDNRHGDRLSPCGNNA